MHNMSHDNVLKALAETGRHMADLTDVEPIRVMVCGAVAGILGGDLSGQRQTLDCDVIASDPRDGFANVAQAAAEVAEELDLKPQWLNQDSSMYAHLLPLGWKTRLQRIDRFGPLEVMIVGRRDLLALKLMGAPQRPQDLDDLEEMKPTKAELDFLRDYLDQQEAESVAREIYDLQRALLDDLRGSL